MKNSIDDKLHNKHVKPTAMRELVLDILSKQTTAISLPDLERVFDKADKVTLYRTLKTFEENKLVHRIDDGSGVVKFAMCTDACQCNPEDLHVHFYCTECLKTYCLIDIAIPTITLPVNFEPEIVNMVVKGICANCRK